MEFLSQEKSSGSGNPPKYRNFGVEMTDLTCQGKTSEELGSREPQVHVVANISQIIVRTYFLIVLLPSLKAYVSKLHDFG